MAWTTPKTWVAGELVDATDLNQHIRDNMTYLYNATAVFTNSYSLASDLTITGSTDSGWLYPDATNLRIDWTSSGKYSLIIVEAIVSPSSTSASTTNYAYAMFDFEMFSGGVSNGRQGGVWGGYISPNITSQSANGEHRMVMQMVVTPTAGSAAAILMWRRNANSSGGTTIYNDEPVKFTVIELPVTP
jgi:hypothetical protein